MKMKNITLAILLVVLCTTGCSLWQIKKTEDSPWVKRWLAATACEPPCWENITPGTTSLYDLQDIPISTETQLQITGPVIYTDTYRFFWNKNGEDSRRSMVSAATVSHRDMTIREIEFGFRYEEGGITVEEAIQLFGEPKSVGVYFSAKPYSCDGVLLYPENKVWIKLEPKKVEKNYLVSTDTALEEVFYLSDREWEERIGSFTKTFFHGKNEIQPWEGFGEYYCRYNGD